MKKLTVILFKNDLEFKEYSDQEIKEDAYNSSDICELTHKYYHDAKELRIHDLYGKYRTILLVEKLKELLSPIIYGEIYPLSILNPSTILSLVLSLLDSSVVIIPSLPTILIASYINSPVLMLPDEIVAISRI